MREGQGAKPAFQRVSGGHTTCARTAQEVVFYRLSKKFVDNERSIPEDVRSVLYYTLAIGHHTGLIDCFDPRIRTSREVFSQVVDLLPEGPARDKLAGVERFGEIQIGKEHVAALRAATLAVLESAKPPVLAEREANVSSRARAQDGELSSSHPCVYAADALSWLQEFVVLLDEVASEAQVYAVGRRVTQ